VVLASVACLGPAANMSAAGGFDRLRSEESAAPVSVSSQAWQYHGGSGRQYQQDRTRPRPVPAWNQASNEGRELADRLISPFFSFDFVVSRALVQKPAISGFKSQAAFANDRSIADPILAKTCSGTPCIDTTDREAAGDTRDEQLMLQIGGLFGILYLAFLVVWFWVTRFRGRPASSART
jgi:hypothetical protein